MRNRPICFVSGCLGSARVSRAGDGVPPSRTFLAPCPDLRSTFLGKTVSAGRRNQHARRVRYPIGFAALLVFAPVVCFAQDAVRSTSTDQEETAEAEQVVVSATRFDIPLDQSPASVSVITSENIEQK